MFYSKYTESAHNTEAGVESGSEIPPPPLKERKKKKQRFRNFSIINDILSIQFINLCRLYFALFWHFLYELLQRRTCEDSSNLFLFERFFVITSFKKINPCSGNIKSMHVQLWIYYFVQINTWYDHMYSAPGRQGNQFGSTYPTSNFPPPNFKLDE